jgi:hypothetical protein
VKGAARDGRAWTCSQAAWFEARRVRRASPAIVPANDATPPVDDAALADEFIKGAGYRFTATKGGQR